MRVLIYKRTHTGDPCRCGIFGVNDCMGSFRGRWNYDAVLGIGVAHPWPNSKEIAGKLTWVGIFPKKGDEQYRHDRGPVFTFDHFRLLDGSGPKLKECANSLWKYAKSRRSFILDLSVQDCAMANVREDVEKLIDKYRNKPSTSKKGECSCREVGSCGSNSHRPSPPKGREPCG